MKKLAMAVVLTATLMACYSFAQDLTRSRVEMMMNGWVEGQPGMCTDIQTAVCMWFEGSRLIADRDTLGQASLDFDAWRRQKNLDRAIASWELESIVSEEGTSPPSWLARVKIEGASYTIRIKEYEPFEWAD